jgi:hypothetical protein
MHLVLQSDEGKELARFKAPPQGEDKVIVSTYGLKITLSWVEWSEAKGIKTTTFE